MAKSFPASGRDEDLFFGMSLFGKMFRDNWLRNFKNGKFSQKIRPDSQKMSINR
jgi:hypothetical protein